MNLLNKTDPIADAHRDLIRLCIFAERQWILPQLADGEFYRNLMEPVLKDLDAFSPAFEKAQSWGDLPNEQFRRAIQSIHMAAGTLGLMPGTRGMNGYRDILGDVQDQLVPLYALLCDMEARNR